MCEKKQNHEENRTSYVHISRMQPSAREKEVQTVPSFASCGGKRQWCLGRSEHIVPVRLARNDVKASVNNTWQISPFCHVLLVGAVVLDGTNGQHEHSFHTSTENTMQHLSKHVKSTERESGCQNTTSRHTSHSDEPQARQMNLSHDSIEAFQRCIFSGQMVFLEAKA